MPANESLQLGRNAVSNASGAEVRLALAGKQVAAGTAARKRRLFFVNRYFHPDHSATSQMLSDLAFALARDGENVVVVASRQLYEHPDARLPARDVVDGVTVYRAGATRFGRTCLIGRALDYLSFHLMAGITLFRHSR